ncbi:MAG: ABC transporter substrate-binding protein [Rikenellaceae bacterium]
MKYLIAFVCLVAGLACGCSSGGQRADLSDFTVSIYQPAYASGFEILGSEESASSLVRITRPWQGEALESFDLLILREGEAAPSDFAGAVIEGEALRIVALSSSNVAMFDRLGEAQRIVGVSGIDYITSANITKRAAEGELHDVGYDTALNYELLTILKPDIVLLYSVSGANSGVTAKLTELNIPYIYIGDYAEESPLGKAEWMVAMGEICGKRTVAEQLFAQSEASYNDLKQKALECSERPAVMLNAPYRDIWYMPSERSYMVRLIEDAGAQYAYKGNSTASTKPISVEEAYALATTSQFWLNTGVSINSMADLRSQVPKFAQMPMVRNSAVYNSTARSTPMGGSDFWESGVVYPERILADLIEIFHPSLIEGEGLYYYKQLE